MINMNESQSNLNSILSSSDYAGPTA